MFAVGYVSGVVRANILSVYTTFMFDAAVLGLYLMSFRHRSRPGAKAQIGPIAGPMVLFLIAWPTLLCFIPINHFLIQLVALRSTVWVAPGPLDRRPAQDRRRPGGDDLRAGSVLNLVGARAGGLYIYFNGVEALYPKNAITRK